MYIVGKSVKVWPIVLRWTKHRGPWTRVHLYFFWRSPIYNPQIFLKSKFPPSFRYSSSHKYWKHSFFLLGRYWEAILSIWKIRNRQRPCDGGARGEAPNDVVGCGGAAPRWTSWLSDEWVVAPLNCRDKKIGQVTVERERTPCWLNTSCGAHGHVGLPTGQYCLGRKKNWDDQWSSWSSAGW